MPSDCRLKQTITPTNSPQSQSMQHSPHHAISVLSSILAKYETAGLLERRKLCDEMLWSRQANSERTSPRTRVAAGAGSRGGALTDDRHPARGADCYCCITSASSSGGGAVCKSVRLKARALSLPQCSFTLAAADFQQTLLKIAAANGAGKAQPVRKNVLVCCGQHCTCAKVQAASVRKSATTKYDNCDDCRSQSNRKTTNDIFCNCSSLRLIAGDVLETTC